MNAWESDVIECKKCIHCDFRAERDKETCCETCTGNGNCASHCPSLTREALERCYWETVQCDVAEQKPAKCLVVPSNRDGPSPVLLFLTGNGHVNDRQDFYSGGVDQLMRNEELKCYTILAPKPLSDSGVMRKNNKWRPIWCEDGLWAMLTEILRRLGAQKVDPKRIYVTGLSLGASGTWNFALRYGRYLAGIAPVSGVCNWPFGAWPRSDDLPIPEVLKQLGNLPLRAYQIDADRYGGSPAGDFGYLCKGLPETNEDLKLRGMDGTQIDVAVRRWLRHNSPCWELWEAKGPLMDWSHYYGSWGDKHCLWQRVYPYPEWGLAAFFEANQVAENYWNVEVASPLSTQWVKDLETAAAWEEEQAAKKAREAEAEQAQSAPMEVETEQIGNMMTGDMEVMQEQKRLRQDDDLARPVSVGT